MIKQILAFLARKGFLVMMTGFFLAVVGLIFFMQTRIAGTYARDIAFGVSIAGFCIYIVGRILVAVERKKVRQQKLRDDLNKG